MNNLFDPILSEEELANGSKRRVPRCNASDRTAAVPPSSSLASGVSATENPRSSTGWRRALSTKLASWFRLSDPPLPPAQPSMTKTGRHRKRSPPQKQREARNGAPGKFNEVATQGNTADIAIARSGGTAKDKFTAADIATNCPARLQEIGREITERLEQAREQTKRLDAHVIAVNKLIAEAKTFATSAASMLSGSCTVRSLASQKAMCCGPSRPEKRRWRIIALRNANAGREPEQAKRQRQPIPGQSRKSPSRWMILPGLAWLRLAASGRRQTPEPAKPRSAVAPADDAQRAFTMRVMELDRSTAGQPPQHFAATAVPVEVLARLGTLLTDIAHLKKSDADGAR